MLKLNFREMTADRWKAKFTDAFREAGVPGFGNSGFSRRQPGQGADDKTHAHRDTEEIYITIGGKATATVDGERIPLEEGDLLIIQPGEEHKLEAAPDSEHENLWFEPDRIRHLSPLPEGEQYLVRDVGACPTVPCPCGESTRVITADDTPAGNVHVTKITDSKRHYHKRCMEYYYVLEGEGRLDIADETVDLKPGAVVVIPPGVAHRAYGDIKALIFGTPAMEPDDEYFDEPSQEGGTQ